WPDKPRTPVNKRGVTVALVIGVFAVLFVAALIAGAVGANTRAARHSGNAGKPALASSQSPPSSRPQPTRPSLASLVGGQCAITYRARGITSMTWTVSVSVSGQLVTRAQDKIGSSYRHVVHMTPGRHVFSAQTPLSQMTAIGGVLYADGASYGCS